MRPSILRLLSAGALFIMLLFGFSVKPQAAEDVIVDNISMSITLPAGYQPASKAVAAIVEKLYKDTLSGLLVWTYTRGVDEEKLNRGDISRIPGYIAVLHLPDGKTYTEATFAQTMKSFSSSRELVKTTPEVLKKQLDGLPSSAAGVDAIALMEQGKRHVMWLCAVDSEESTPQKRDIMLTGELLMLRDAKVMMVYFFRFYTGPQDLQTLLSDMAAFKKANLAE